MQEEELINEVTFGGKTYRVYPGFEIAASDDGEFINIKSGRTIMPKIHHGYAEVRQRTNGMCISLNAKKVMIQLYRPEWINEKVISHIDGDISNFAISNLCVGERFGMSKEQIEYVGTVANMNSDEMSEFRMTEDKKIWVSRDGRLIRNFMLLDMDSLKKTASGSIILYVNGRQKTLARIIYETFACRKLSEDEYVCYIDGNRRNVSFDNLCVLKKNDAFKMWKHMHLNDKEIAKEIDRRVRETEMIVYWFATREWDKYTKYLMNEIYPHLIETGLKYVNKQKAEIGAREVVGSLYMLISKNRVIDNYWRTAEKMMTRWIKRENTQTSEMKLVDKEKIDNFDVFKKIAEKYGITIIA